MSAAAVIAIILSCHDGDTCRLDREVLPGRDRVRIANIDAPEIGAGADCLAERLLAELSRDALAAHVGVTVRLEDVAADKYPRRVDARVILPDGRDLGELLIAMKLARPWQGRRVDWCD